QISSPAPPQVKLVNRSNQSPSMTPSPIYKPLTLSISQLFLFPPPTPRRLSLRRSTPRFHSSSVSLKASPSTICSPSMNGFLDRPPALFWDRTLLVHCFPALTS